MPEMTSFHCFECLCQKKFTLEGWELNHIQLHHLEHIEVARQENVTIRSVPWCIEPAQHRQFHTQKDAVEVLDIFPFMQHIENITDSESQPMPPLLPWMETYPGASSSLSEFIAEWWECNAQGCLEKNRQNNPYHPFATHAEYKYIHCGIKMIGMKMYYDNMLKEENTTLCFQASKMGLASGSLWLACQMIRLSGSGHYTLSRRWDAMTITNAQSNPGVGTSSKAWYGWCDSKPTSSIQDMTLSIALTTMFPENAAIPNVQCKLGVGDTGMER